MTNIQPAMDPFERPDPVLTNKIVTHLKSQGIFDQFRRECMADVDTKPAYHNLRQRVEGSVAAFLRLNPWRPDMNKNQLRDNLRKHIQSGGFLDIGVDRIVDQVVNPKIYTVFLPKVEEIVQSCMGMENNKPKFEPPPIEANSEESKFQEKHNLASRSKLPAPLLGPMHKPLNIANQTMKKPSPDKDISRGKGEDTDTEEMSDKKFVVDDDELEDKEEEDEDDEESPPFEPHSEGDRLILGTRSESSENSNDSQLVTTIVDDNLEERIDNNENSFKEDSDKKDEDSSSDEYVPKTPTINMEESDGTVHEFNSIAEYKQYQTKFEEESLGNVEEVVESMNENHNIIKEERSSDLDFSINGSQKRKFKSDSYDDASSGNSDRESTGDEIKPAVFESFMKKRFKLEEYDNENETSELSNNEVENDDSYTEQSLDMTDSKLKVLESDADENCKDSSTSSGDTGKSYHTHHSESSNHYYSKERTDYNDYDEKTSKDKNDIHENSEYDESSREHYKERDRKRSESSSKHNEKETKAHDDKYNVKDRDSKRNKSSERSKKEKHSHRKNREESTHERNDHHDDSKSISDQNKDKKKHSSRDRHSVVKEDRETKKSDKGKNHESKHKHSSSRHSHQSSLEKHRSDKEHKHKGSHDRHKSRGNKDDKDRKDKTKKKHRHQCKYTSDKDENRRSSDGDSSGPSESTHKADSLKSRPLMTSKESKHDSGERMTSNSDNTVSDNVEEITNDSKFDVSIERTIASSDFQMVKDSLNKSDLKESDWNCSKGDQDQRPTESQSNYGGFNEVQDTSIISRENVNNYQNTYSLQSQHVIPGNHNDSSQGFVDTVEKSTDVAIVSAKLQESAIPFHDSSSERENVKDEKELMNTELDNTNNHETLCDDSTVLKFKKPKIAKNIHEVKKIMEARRHLKHMEKKRMKLLTKSKLEGYESDEKSSSENKSEDEYQILNKSSDEESLNESNLDVFQNDVFRGFPNDFKEEKLEKYHSLTERLEKEILELEKLTNHEQLNTNLVTSWIDLNPNFDSYIENTLNGKVHRRYRINIPPICDAYYKYDSKQNVYFLMKNWDAPEQKDAQVDSNLNNINCVGPADQQENMSSSYAGITKLRENYAENNSTEKEAVNDKKIVDSGVIAPLQTVAFITFNQTYDEVLKEKAQNSVVPSKRELEEFQKTPCTVVKITNNKSSEQVFMKQLQSNSEGKVQNQRITMSETIINGKMFGNSLDSKRFPLISRITKEKNSTHHTIKMKHLQANGVSSNPTNNFEDKYPMGVSQKIINDVIGIQSVTLDQGNSSDQGSQSGEEPLERKRRRRTGCRQQRYDSSDLYKPRLQLSSRRIRAASSSPEEGQVPPVVISITNRRKRSAAVDLNTSSTKCRR